MSGVKVEFKGLKELEKELKELDTEKVMENIANKTLETFLSITKSVTPVGTGHLRNSWKANKEKIKDGFEVVVSTNVEYAPYVNNGHRIMRDEVQIGYYEGQHFVEKAKENTKNKIQDIVDAEIMKVLGVLK